MEEYNQTASDAGNCSAGTKLLTLGFTNDEAAVSEIGDGFVRSTLISPVEDIGLSIALPDRAIKGNMYEDYSGPEQIDGMNYAIDSKEDVENVLKKGLFGTADAALAQITAEDLQAVTFYADLKALYMSDQLKADALADR